MKYRYSFLAALSQVFPRYLLALALLAHPAYASDDDAPDISGEFQAEGQVPSGDINVGSAISPEVNAQASPTPSAQPPKKAENIDLKEVVTEPLEASVPVVPTTAPVPQEPVTETIDSSVEAPEPSAKDKEPSAKEAEPSPQAKQPPAETPVEASPTPSPAISASAPEPAVDQSEDASTPAETETTAEPSVTTTEEGAVEKVKETSETAIAQDTPAEPPSATEEPSLISKLAQEIVGTAEAPAQPPLVLLDNEVQPGTSTRLAWSPSVSFMGISAPTAVLVLNGAKAGPTLCLTAAVHGDELNGIEIVRRVLYDIDPNELSGAVIGVPIVNLQGFRRASRYLADRRDLNRFFPGNPRGSSAARIAHSFFSSIITHCDFLIDLHTGSFRRTNLPQLRANLSSPEVADLAKKMGSIVVVQSEGAVGSLRRAAVESGVPAVTLEAGAPHELQKTAVEHGVKSIETAMDGLGMIKRRRFWERSEEPVYYQSRWVRTMEGGILFSEVPLGAMVNKGDLLGTVTDPITNQRSNIVAPFDGRVIGMALNQVMYPGYAAYHIGLRASVEEAAKQTSEPKLPVDVDAAATDTHGDPEMPGEQGPVEVEATQPAQGGAVTSDADADMQLPIEDSE